MAEGVSGEGRPLRDEEPAAIPLSQDAPMANEDEWEYEYSTTEFEVGPDTAFLLARLWLTRFA